MSYLLRDLATSLLSHAMPSPFAPMHSRPHASAPPAQCAGMPMRVLLCVRRVRGAAHPFRVPPLVPRSVLAASPAPLSSSFWPFMRAGEKGRVA